MAIVPITPTLHWVYNGIEQVVSFVNADDAKTCWQALAQHGIIATFRIPQGYKEIPLKHYEEDGLLSEDQILSVKTKISKMTLVY